MTLPSRPFRRWSRTLLSHRKIKQLSNENRFAIQSASRQPQLGMLKRFDKLSGPHPRTNNSDVIRLPYIPRRLESLQLAYT